MEGGKLSDVVFLWRVLMGSLMMDLSEMNFIFVQL